MPGGKAKIEPKDGKPFKKGDPRINRKGRPRKLPNLDHLLAEVLADKKGDCTAMEAILRGLRLKAIKGDVRAAELLIDRAYGKQKQPSSLEVNIEKLSPAELDIIIDNILNKQIKK